jgi:hypothetical protein
MFFNTWTPFLAGFALLQRPTPNSGRFLPGGNAHAGPGSIPTAPRTTCRASTAPPAPGPRRARRPRSSCLRALRNTLISQLRARRRRPATTELVEELPAATRAADDPAEATEQRQVYAAISELPAEFRDALVAVDVAGLSYDEAARALGEHECGRRENDPAARQQRERPAAEAAEQALDGSEAPQPERGRAGEVEQEERAEASRRQPDAAAHPHVALDRA